MNPFVKGDVFTFGHDPRRAYVVVHVREISMKGEVDISFMRFNSNNSFFYECCHQMTNMKLVGHSNRIDIRWAEYKYVTVCRSMKRLEFRKMMQKAAPSAVMNAHDNAERHIYIKRPYYIS